MQNGSMRRRSSGSNGYEGRKMTPSTGQSSSTFQNSRYSSSSSSSYKFSGIREEEGYSYQENRKSSGYSKYANDGGLSNGMNGMSLDGLRKPKIDSWDSMGILGLSSKMWNDTSKRQETFMSSTGQFLREENYNSYIMWRCIQKNLFLTKFFCQKIPAAVCALVFDRYRYIGNLPIYLITDSIVFGGFLNSKIMIPISVIFVNIGRYRSNTTAHSGSKCPKTRWPDLAII